MLGSIFDSTDWMPLLTGTGFGAAVAVILLYQFIGDKTVDRKRLADDRDKDRERIDKLEQFQQTTLLDLIKRDATIQQQTLDVISQNAEVTKENTRVTLRCLAALDNYQRIVEQTHKLFIESKE